MVGKNPWTQVSYPDCYPLLVYQDAMPFSRVSETQDAVLTFFDRTKIDKADKQSWSFGSYVRPWDVLGSFGMQKSPSCIFLAWGGSTSADVRSFASEDPLKALHTLLEESSGAKKVKKDTTGSDGWQW